MAATVNDGLLGLEAPSSAQNKLKATVVPKREIRFRRMLERLGRLVKSGYSSSTGSGASSCSRLSSDDKAQSPVPRSFARTGTVDGASEEVEEEAESNAARSPKEKLDDLAGVPLYLPFRLGRLEVKDDRNARDEVPVEVKLGRLERSGRDEVGEAGILLLGFFKLWIYFCGRCLVLCVWKIVRRQDK